MLRKSICEAGLRTPVTLFATTGVSQYYVQLLQTDYGWAAQDVERMNLHRETRSGVIDRLHLVDQVRHRHLASQDTVPESIRERLREIFESWNTVAEEQIPIPRKVRFEVSGLARKLRDRGFSITEQQLLRDSIIEGWRIVKAKYSNSCFPRSGEQG